MPPHCVSRPSQALAKVYNRTTCYPGYYHLTVVLGGNSHATHNRDSTFTVQNYAHVRLPNHSPVPSFPDRG